MPSLHEFDEGRRGSKKSLEGFVSNINDAPGRSLLGDLPTLERKVGEADIKNFMNLQLEMHRGGKSNGNGARGGGGAQGEGHLSDRAFLNGGTGAEGLLLSPSGRKVSA